MDYNKNEILRDCRELLHLVHCEIVVDVSDGQLFNVLFQSDVKKEALLKWLIQQMYSSDVCSNSSMEDLVSMFIPKSQYRSFLIGTMPIAEQYKKWKLIMSTLYKKLRRQNFDETMDYEEEILNGGLLEKYEEIWSEKNSSTPKHSKLIMESPKKTNFHELKTEMEKAKKLLSQWKSQEKHDEKNLNAEECKTSVFEAYKQSSENLNEILEHDFYPYLNDLRRTGPYAFRYEYLDSKMIKNITKNAQALCSNMETLNNVLRGVENYKSQEHTNVNAD